MMRRREGKGHHGISLGPQWLFLSSATASYRLLWRLFRTLDAWLACWLFAHGDHVTDQLNERGKMVDTLSSSRMTFNSVQLSSSILPSIPRNSSFVYRLAQPLPRFNESNL